MKILGSDAERWEQGCEDDSIRNNFIAPNLARLIELLKPRTILDIGTGTGYVPRVIDRSLSYRPEWTLIDSNPLRLALADALKGSDMHVATVEGDILEHSFEEPFEAVLITFTLLEIIDFFRLSDRLGSLVQPDGLLLLSLPDAWRDVIIYGAKDPNKVSEYLAGAVSIPKIDKFTTDSYPFRAIRIERIISRVLEVGFELFELIEKVENDIGVFVLAFRRRGAVRS